MDGSEIAIFYIAIFYVATFFFFFFSDIGWKYVD